VFPTLPLQTLGDHITTLVGGIDVTMEDISEAPADG